jgi:hypothetical protein
MLRPAGDSHNFGRRVVVDGARVHKPRTVFWEWLLLSAGSPLRRRFVELGAPFDFLPDLAFERPEAIDGGSVERIVLEPLPRTVDRRSLALVAGRAIALHSWLGLADLHWENLVIGAAGDRIVFAPLDVELIFGDLGMPTETKLLPDPDPEYAAICRHAAGVRRLLPWLGKPVEGASIAAIARAYRETLVFLDRNAASIAEVFGALPALRTAPIRVMLRSTEEYVTAGERALWPPLLDAERVQISRGDVPYFFRLYGQPGIHWFVDPELRAFETLPLEGDVPQLDRLLRVERALSSKNRAKLRDEGLFTVIGAFDHRGLTGRHEDEDLAITFQRRTLILDLAGEEITARRDLRAFVESVYLPCECGEVESPFVPAVTRCTSR